MLISYAITACNEVDELTRLLNFILKYKRPQDEICVLLDKPKAPSHMLDLLYWYSSRDLIKLKESTFQGHFADWKNELNRMCSGDYIFNIDADEIPNFYLIDNLSSLLENNDTDLFWVPRINTLIGDKDEINQYVKSQGWSINDKGWINWPNDFQGRIYRRDPNIKWVGKVHEKIEGHKSFAYYPDEEFWALYHPKTIDKQEKQNEFYNTI
jgi:hypothetical protein